VYAAVAGQLAQQPAQRVAAVQLVAAEGQHQHDPARPQGGGQVGEQVAGGAVGPVQVLHDQQQRRAGGQPLDQPQQQLEQAPLAGLAGTSVGGRLVAPGQVGQQAGQLLAGGAGDRLKLGRVELAGQAPQRLGDRRERHAFLAQRHAAAIQHPHTLLAGGYRQLLGQPGLADPGLPADHRRQRLAGGDTRQQVLQPRQLLGAADEPPGRDLVCHVGPSMPAGSEEGRARI
jgi:hypothetical protein